jgi:hypothetical protein
MRGLRLLTTALAAVALSASVALAVGPPVDFAPGYGFEGVRAPGDHTSTAGEELEAIGFIGVFNTPLDFLDAVGSAEEFTFVVKDLISLGTTTVGSGMFTTYTTYYSGGVFEIYRDASKDASTNPNGTGYYGDPSDDNYANPGTFANGELILTGTLSNFGTKTFGFQAGGDILDAAVTITGGTYASLFSGCANVTLAGTFSVSAGFVSPTATAAGAFSLVDLELFADCPTPVEPSTWGRIKNQFN